MRTDEPFHYALRDDDDEQERQAGYQDDRSAHPRRQALVRRTDTSRVQRATNFWREHHLDNLARALRASLTSVDS
jgi:hypothetical protein